MNRTLIAVLLFGAVFASWASAAPGERGYSARDQRVEYTRNDRAGPARHDSRRDYAPAPRYGAAQTRNAAPRYLPPRGYQSRQWQRGHYLPAHYRARPYVLDYRAYRLAAPPRGYHYVRVDDRAILVAITSGLIANVFNDMFYR